jgi:hypothetical protein
LTLKVLKAKEINMELTSVSGDALLQISAGTKWRTHFVQRRTELRDDPQSTRYANSELAQMIAELIREPPFLSCKILGRHLRVSKETCLRFFHEKLELKKFHLRWVPDQLTANRT